MYEEALTPFLGCLLHPGASGHPACRPREQCRCRGTLSSRLRIDAGQFWPGGKPLFWAANGTLMASGPKTSLKKFLRSLPPNVPSNPRFITCWVIFAMNQERYNEALTNYLTAVRLDPDYLNAWVKIQEVSENDAVCRPRRGTKLPSTSCASTHCNVTRRLIFNGSAISGVSGWLLPMRPAINFHALLTCSLLMPASVPRRKRRLIRHPPRK